MGCPSGPRPGATASRRRDSPPDTAGSSCGRPRPADADAGGRHPREDRGRAPAAPRRPPRARRARPGRRAGRAVGEAHLDQCALAGIGNVWRCEVLFIERVDPFLPVSDVDDATIGRLASTARRLLLASAGRSGGTARRALGGVRGAAGRLWVYGRAGRPCRRCGTILRSTRLGRELPRLVTWCPACQGGARDGRETVSAAPAALDG